MVYPSRPSSVEACLHPNTSAHHVHPIQGEVKTQPETWLWRSTKSRLRPRPPRPWARWILARIALFQHFLSTQTPATKKEKTATQKTTSMALISRKEKKMKKISSTWHLTFLSAQTSPLSMETNPSLRTPVSKSLSSGPSIPQRDQIEHIKYYPASTIYFAVVRPRSFIQQGEKEMCPYCSDLFGLADSLEMHKAARHGL